MMPPAQTSKISTHLKTMKDSGESEFNLVTPRRRHTSLEHHNFNERSGKATWPPSSSSVRKRQGEGIIAPQIHSSVGRLLCPTRAAPQRLVRSAAGQRRSLSIGLVPAEPTFESSRTWQRLNTSIGRLLATELRYASENSSALSREASRTVKCAQIAETGTLNQLMKERGATFPRSRQPSPVELVQAPKERDIVREAVMRLAKGSTEVSGDRTLSR